MKHQMTMKIHEHQQRKLQQAPKDTQQRIAIGKQHDSSRFN